jgi:hypothetical protein
MHVKNLTFSFGEGRSQGSCVQDLFQIIISKDMRLSCSNVASYHSVFGALFASDGKRDWNQLLSKQRCDSFGIFLDQWKR